MIKILIALLVGLNMTAATIDRIEENYAVVEICYNDEISFVDIEVDQFNTQVSEAEELTVSQAIGAFSVMEGNEYYQFKSYDDAEWWSLTAEEIGFVPEVNKPYTLLYHNNNTTECLECAEELECECEVYDDIFLALYEGGM